MMNIYRRIYIHPFFYLFCLLIIITGHFKAFTNIMVIVLFHELGHILGALIFKWKIKRVLILPFGCMTEFNEKLNRPIYQELIILIMGPLFQILLYQFYKTSYHYPLLLLNLMPIYPLDGSKFIFLFWNIVGSYYNSYIVTFVVSYISIFFLLIKYHNFIILLFDIYLLITSIEIFKNKDYYFYMFLYERYKDNYPYYRKKIIKGNKYKKMKRSNIHFFIIENKIIEERKQLSFLFKYKENKSI